MKSRPLQAGHRVELLIGGAGFFPALVSAIAAARSEVWLETYIFHFDASGVSVAQALEEAAHRGISVRLVMDGIGTPEVPPEWMQRFDAAGVRWQRFSPLGKLGLLVPGRWRRMHRKLCVVDQQVLFCGGINLLDDYFELSYGPQDSPRLDYAVRVEGPLVADGQGVVQQFWRRLMATRQLKQGHLPTAEALARSATHAPPGAVAATGANASSSQGAAARSLPAGEARAALLLRDNVRNRRTIERAYRLAIAQARSEVVIANAYFLPGAQLRRALVHAARRGVRVQLLLQGRYEYFMQFHAAKPFYAGLLAAGVEIYEYHAAYLHAKVAVVDKHWATVGSSNLDPLSLLLAREANVVVEDADFASLLHSRLADAIANGSTAIEARSFANRPAWQRAKDWIAYGVMRATLFLTGRDY